ncbi:MAG: hypothetical protein EXS13_00735 [Planctomycetes bacterium]|nr:hypothetical protein [Planctomycetota bacterium]
MRKLFAASAALLAVLSTASAQDGKGTKRRAQDAPEFDQPATSSAGGQKESKVVTPETALNKALPVVTTWPAEAGENALRALAARGTEVVPLLRARLANGTVLERAAAARGLTLLADRDSFSEIEKLFADPRQRARFTPLLSALNDLDSGRASALSLRFLQSEQGPLRRAARALLRRDPTKETLQQLTEVLETTRSDGVRRDLFELLVDLKEPGLPALALANFLGAKDASLAKSVTELLSWQDAPEIFGELVRLAGGERERRNLHAALALALHEQRTGGVVLPESLFDHYLPMVRTSDLLLRATACVVCGMIGYREDARREVAKATVVPALADGVVNGRFFGDFELCFKSSVATLELQTGEHFGSSIPAWREWFSKNPDARFAGKSELQGLVLAEDELDAVVVTSRADATGLQQTDLVLCGDRHRAQVAGGVRPGAMVLELETMRALLISLEAQGLLLGELPRQLTPSQAGDLVVRVTTRGRERVVAVRVDDPKIRAFDAALSAAAEPTLWQQLLTFDTTYPQRFAEEHAWYTTHLEPAPRKSRLIDLALTSISGDDPDAVRRAFSVLGRVHDLGASVRATQVDALAAQLARLPPGDMRADKLLDLLISTHRDDAFERVVDALAPRGGAAQDAIASALLRMDRADRGVDDARPPVRMAALALVERDQLVLADDRLITLARTDGDERVRGKALALLARRGGDAGVALLLEQAESAPPLVRTAALRLLGLSHREDALQCLIAAMRGTDPSLAASALEGLSTRGDERAAEALDALVRERGTDDALGRLALASIKGLPRPLAIERLRRLVSEAAGALSREAAYGLADLGEMDAVPTLLADLEEEKLHRRARTLLTYLFCKDPGTESWRFRSLHESTPGLSHADHFLAALKEGGALVPEGNDLSDRSFQQLLVAALEDARWFVRRSALELLEAAHARVLGSLAHDATPDEIRALASRWREAIEVQASGGH